MALFGKLFSKETCAICGQEVGALKKRKLADGFMCKDCEKLLSPWFYTRSEATIAQIKDQLAQREQNLGLLDQFVISQIVGGASAIYLDEEHGWFCALMDAQTGSLLNLKQIDSVEGLKQVNADIITLDQVRDAKVKPSEREDEIKHEVDGEQVSYNPRRYRYEEGFDLYIWVDHPFIDEIHVPLGAVQIETEGRRQESSLSAKALGWLMDDPNFDIQKRAKAYENNTILKELTRGDWEMPDYAYGFRCSYRNQESIRAYARAKQQAEDVRDWLLGR